MNILILIPARAGSKGIPQKNIKFLHGKPLISYAIKNAREIKNSEVFISTDSENIEHIAHVFKAKTLFRDLHHDDKATIDDVAFYELKKLFEKKKQYDIIITLQPTSPLLKQETLNNALDYFIENNLTSLVSVSEKRHLSWKYENSTFKKLYQKRVNRQELEPIFEENGAFVICKADYLLEHKTRISNDMQIYTISDEESIDIDTKNDWLLAESILQRRNIAFIAYGSENIGMGHIYRILTLSNKFHNDNIFFYSQEDNLLGIEKIQSLNYPVKTYKNTDTLIQQLKQDNINIVINDILDTDISYISKLKENKFFIINFEDTGSGVKNANIVFNALYEWSNTSIESHFGYKYEILREDIYLYPIKKSVDKDIKRILLSFGGTDIENATLKVLQSLIALDISSHITVILGVGYQYTQILNDFLNTIDSSNITVIQDIKFMSDYIYENDLVISGNGRMVYEVVSLGVPLIVVSQNEREMTHIFPTICQGIAYLGYINNLTKEKIKETVLFTLTYEQRKYMNQELISFAKEIRQGPNRVVSIINEKYSEFIDENN